MGGYLRNVRFGDKSHQSSGKSPFQAIFCDMKNLPITRHLIPNFLRAPSVGAITVLKTERGLLLAGGDASFPGLTPGASGNVDELRLLSKNERDPGCRDQRPEWLL